MDAKDAELRKIEENFKSDFKELSEKMKNVELEKEELVSQLSTEKFQSGQKISELLRDIQDLQAANNQGGYTMTQFDRNHLEIQRIVYT